MELEQIAELIDRVSASELDSFFAWNKTVCV